MKHFIAWVMLITTTLFPEMENSAIKSTWEAHALSSSLYENIEYGNLESARQLIRNGADPVRLSTPISNVASWHPLYMENNLLVVAKQHNYTNMIPMLLEEGADPNSTAANGEFALAHMLSLSEFELFNQYGFNYLQEDETGNTMLVYTVDFNYAIETMWLLDHGCSVDKNAIFEAFDEIVTNEKEVDYNIESRDDLICAIGILAKLLNNVKIRNNVQQPLYDLAIEYLQKYQQEGHTISNSIMCKFQAAFGSVQGLHLSDNALTELAMAACAAGNIDNLKYLCQKTSPHSDLLGISAYFHQEECVDYLLSISVKPEYIGSVDNHAPYIADAFSAFSICGNTSYMKKMIDAGYPLTSVSLGQAAVFAVENGNADALRFLIQNGYNPNDCFDEFESNVLTIACRNGNYEIVNLLLGAGLSLNSYLPSDAILSLIRESGRINDTEIIKLLLKYGASAIEPKDASPIYTAVYCDRPEIVEIFFAYGDFPISDDLLVESAAKSNRMMMLLLEKNANINACNESGESMLISAIQYNKVENVRYLLAHGVDISIRDEHGYNAAYYAEISRNPQIQALFS